MLISEDESRLALLLEQTLAEEGWSVSVVTDGPSALSAALAGGYDVLLLDWMLPVLQGPAVVARLRAQGVEVPVLMLTARGSLADRVEGLDAGADDDLSKPFEVEELLARLPAPHRRAVPSAVTAWRAADLVVDTPARGVSRGGREVELSAREFDVLALLVERVGEVVSRYAIRDGVWDGQTDIASKVIDVHVGRIRAKSDAPFGRSAIHTLRGAGYRLDPAGG